MKITEQVMRVSSYWVKVMQKEYGHEVGLKCFDVMREAFGNDLSGAVLFSLLKNNVAHDHITITCPPGYQKINAIKALRAITGLGLAETKRAVEDAETREVILEVSQSYLNDEQSRELENKIRELENAGVNVY